MYIVLGTALDGISMIVLTTSVVLPMIEKAGFDLVWFGIFVVLIVEMAEVSPPVGFNLFVLQTMSGKDTNTVALASLPFFFLLVVAVAHHHHASGDRDVAAEAGVSRIAARQMRHCTLQHRRSDRMKVTRRTTLGLAAAVALLAGPAVGPD